jgi:hypothetical protein
VLHVAAEESGLRGAGSETMLAKLAELIFVEVIRKHITRLGKEARDRRHGFGMSKAARR